ncbi:LOW QUALITY PROTEIN: phospholipid phosphatase-related protein type 5-like [Babylonia areolata]|uniref:LOW QUALITY PROTEIN: phospholipid phosphatase-related protein type 5-like n=1 Tax=Babylonia areolata TaxID=304850 RepID=UPI003FD53868
MFSVCQEHVQRYPGLFPQHPLQHFQRDDDLLTMAYTTIGDLHHLPGAGAGGVGGGGGGGGGGGRPGYSMVEISSSDYVPSSSSSRRESRQGVLIGVTFVVECLLLVSVGVLEYFLRWTDIFPVRRQNFTCSDDSIACTSRDKELMSEFAFGGKVPDIVVYIVTFCVPPVMQIVMGEATLHTLSSNRQHRILRVADTFCAVPHVCRRLLRFLGVYLFGAISLMVFSDVTRNMIGRLRPDFLETCGVNLTLCSESTTLDDNACLNTDKMQMRHARTSFPSVQSALSTFAAVFISVYIHGAWRCHAVRITRVFLTLGVLLLAVLGGLSEYCTCVSHWTDVAAGWGAGLTMSLYLAVYVLNGFQDEVTEAEIQHMLRAFLGDGYWTYGDKSHLARPLDQHVPHTTLPRIPSMPEPPPHQSLPSSSSSSAPPTTSASSSLSSGSGGSRHHQQQQARQRQRPFTMFQRDLSESVEQHQQQRRQTSSSSQSGPSHM